VDEGVDAAFVLDLAVQVDDMDAVVAGVGDVKILPTK
jgi:hypothetical protein